MGFRRLAGALFFGFLLVPLPCMSQMPEAIKSEIALTWWNSGAIGIAFDGLGDPKFGHTTNSGQYYDFAHVALTSLFDNDVQTELGFEQVLLKRLESSLIEANKAIEAGQLSPPETPGPAGTRQNASPGTPDKASAKPTPSSPFEQIYQALVEQLSDEQKRRWDQLIVREWIDNLGWPHVLNQTAVGEWLDLDNDQRTKILDVAVALQKEIADDVRNLERKVYTDLLEILPIETRSTLEKWIESTQESAQPELDLLVFYLDAASTQNPKIRDPEQRLGNPTSDNPLVLGRALIASEPSFNPRRVGKWQVVRFPIDQIQYYDLLTDKLLFQRNVQKELSLLAYQINELNQLHHKKIQTRNRISQGTIDSATEHLVGEMQEPTVKEMLEVLLPHQREALARIVLRRQIRMIGLPILILDERLDAGSLKPNDREKIIRKAAKLHHELESARKRIGQNVEMKFREILTKTQRKKLSSLIGQPFRFFVPSVDRIMLQLKMGDHDRQEYEEEILRSGNR